MKSKKITYLLTVSLVIAVIAYLVIENSQKSNDNVLKVGWMTTWAEGGMTIEPLKNTDILEKNNANVDLISFLYGPPMVEAALSNQIDVLFVGWVPAISLISKSDEWVIVSRLAYFPMEIMAGKDSGIKNIQDLKGKKIAVPYATGPYPVVIESLKKSNIDPKEDVEIINIKPSDLGIALESKEVDAVSWAEPSLTIFKQNDLAYPIEEYEDISFIVVSKTYAEENPQQIINFLKSVKDAQFYTSKNKEQVFKWFSEDSRFDLSVVNSLKIIEPNYNSNNLGDVKLGITEEWIRETQKKIDFEFEEGIIDKRIILRDHIDSSFLNKIED